MAVMAAVATTSSAAMLADSRGKAELDTLTLDHILSDLEALGSDPPLLSVASTSSSTQAGTNSSRTSQDLLTSFEKNTFAGGRKEYVQLSHELLASFRNAQRLNSEQVSAREVGLLLPSERSRPGPSTSAASSGAGRSRGGGETRSTRTDLLHAKVADLQTQVDAWDEALEYAVKLAEDPAAAQKSVERDEAERRDVERVKQESKLSLAGAEVVAEGKDGPHDTTEDRSGHPHSHNASQPSSKDAATFESSAPAKAAAMTEEAQDFQDDDPWNDLS